MAGILSGRSVGQGRQPLQAQVDAHHRARVLWHHVLLLDQQRDVPVSRLLGDGGRRHLHAAGGQVLALLQAQPAQARELHRIRGDDDGPRQPETAQPTFLGLVLGKAQFASVLPRRLEPHPAKEVIKGAIQVA